jgi:hypothetical protein
MVDLKFLNKNELAIVDHIEFTNKTLKQVMYWPLLTIT